jgi:hypothetical protein
MNEMFQSFVHSELQVLTLTRWLARPLWAHCREEP